MQVNIINETDNKIFLKLELEEKENKCPFCNSSKIVIHQKFNYVILNQKGIKEFLKKEVYIKKDRYKCKDCNKTFSVKSIFPDRIFDNELKPILRVLFDRNLLKTFEINKTILKKLNIDESWLLLRANKVLTIINIYTLEIKEFVRVINKKEVKVINDKVVLITKVSEYTPFIRKHKGRITYKRK